MIFASITALLAAALHTYIFYIESIAWEKLAPKVFGIPKNDINTTKEMAYNQGFYNLFLGLIALSGVIALAWSKAVGISLISAGTAAMLGAALVLALSSPEKRKAAGMQGLFPALTLLFLIFFA